MELWTLWKWHMDSPQVTRHNIAYTKVTGKCQYDAPTSKTKFDTFYDSVDLLVYAAN